MAYRATLKDVAAAAGVSVTTVSLVLNNRPARVSEEKRKAIADAAKKLLAVGESKRDDALDASAHAAYTALCLEIFNFDEALTKE